MSETLAPAAPRRPRRAPENVSAIVEILRTDAHPLVQMEQINAITATEAARRLGVSVRQYQRYKKPGAFIPPCVKRLVDLGALRQAPANRFNLDQRIEEWERQHSGA
jgi:hypothetical protein